MKTLTQHTGWNVIVAEDDDDDYFIFTMVIEEMPFQVYVSRAGDGGELMSMLSQTVPDILFLDLLMPRKNGLETLREIRKDSRFAHLPIIIISSLAGQQHVKFCFENGASRYLYKDASLQALKDNLAAIFSQDWQHGHQPPVFEEFVINN